MMLLDIVKVYLIIGTIVSVPFMLSDLYRRIDEGLPIPKKSMLYDCIAHSIDVIAWPYLVVIFVKIVIEVFNDAA